MKRTTAFFSIISLCLAVIMLFSACDKVPTPPVETTAETTAPSSTPVDVEEQPNDFNSRTQVTYHNINGKDVNLYTFCIQTNEPQNNPNFAQAVMLWQAIRYKDAHPDEEVYATISSFHFSIVLAACLDEKSENYGMMKNLYETDYTEDGYYRLSYLCLEAARKGINITVIGQIDASAVLQDENSARPDISFAGYFNSHLNDPAYIEGKTVKDFMNFRHAKWLSYGDKSATDMMHLKLCTVSNYIDNSGVEHGTAVWMGSINLDGVDYRGINGNNSIQTGLVITDHDELYRVLYNYVNILKDWCEQEDALTFRTIANAMATEQIDLIKAGRENEIPADEQIVYLGTENDKIFKMYTTPFGGAGNTWNTDYNPYCTYISELAEAAKGEDSIEFIWNSAKFNQNFDLGDVMMKVLADSFEKSANLNNRLHLKFVSSDKFIPETFSALEVGKNIGYLSINNSSGHYHSKDIHLSYVKEGVRHYVTLVNTLNLHEGSMCYQSNLFLVIDETVETGNNFYVDYLSMLLPSIELERINKEN